MSQKANRPAWPVPRRRGGALRGGLACLRRCPVCESDRRRASVSAHAADLQQRSRHGNAAEFLSLGDLSLFRARAERDEPDVEHLSGGQTDQRAADLLC